MKKGAEFFEKVTLSIKDLKLNAEDIHIITNKKVVPILHEIQEKAKDIRN